MKVIIVGGVAGGATTATRLRRLDEKAEIIMIDRGNHISFANCGLPYYVGDVIKRKEDLLLQTPESFNKRFNIDVRIRQEVIEIKPEEKKVLIKKVDSGEEYEESYDKLVLSPGAEPINPFKNLKSKRIKTLRTVEDSIEIKEYIRNNNIRDVTIIGGGYIGVEMAENLINYPNLSITIVQKGSHLINPIDEDMACFVHKKLKERNINVVVHIINGLPYETENMMIDTVKHLNKLNIDGIKIHMLAILKDTPLEKYYYKNNFKILTKDEYINIVIKQLEYLNPKIVIHRLTEDPDPSELIEPKWLTKKIDILNKIDKIMASKDIYQGDKVKEI